MSKRGRKLAEGGPSFSGRRDSVNPAACDVGKNELRDLGKEIRKQNSKGTCVTPFPVAITNA